MIEFNFACYASVMGPIEEAKYSFSEPLSSTSRFDGWRSMMKILSHYGTGSADGVRGSCKNFEITATQKSTNSFARIDRSRNSKNSAKQRFEMSDLGHIKPM